jgi:hypothetical protein
VKGERGTGGEEQGVKLDHLIPSEAGGHHFGAGSSG